ncbi:PAS domain-containing protein [Halorientalis salina]|uniref:PAS domain-containing protein n=1 Tax=Halorientalis salina TaxID=2932266 RepID=UPI0010AD535A|nr:PAS domain-containing protein [Halorientalis salina]
MDIEDPEEQLRISATIRDINRGLVEADTLRELETAVCETFAESEPYVFAWIGEHDAENGAVVPRTAAGVGEDYCDDLVIAVDEPPGSRGPTAKAVRTCEVRVVQDIRNNPDYEPWRENALERGYEASAAVPLDWGEGACYVLNVYTDRPDGFDDAERTLLAELGETIANAIDGIQARTDLQAQKERYERLTERVDDGFYAVDTDWTITYWNDGVAERTGVPESEVLGESLWDAFPELLGTEMAEQYRTAMATEAPVSFEEYIGEPFGYWVEVDVYPDADGLSVFSREITERKVYERRLEAIIENTRNAIFIKDRDGEYQLANDAAARLFGSGSEDLLGKTDAELFDESSAAELREVDREVIETGEPVTRESVTHIDGREHVFLTDKFPYRDGAGNVVGVMGISHDITGRKARDRDLRETKRRLDLALDGTNTGVWERNLETDRTSWNESMEELFGLDTETFEGTYDDFMELVHPDDIPEIARAHQQAIKHNDLYEAEYRIQPDDSTAHWVEARGQVVENDDGQQRMIGVVTDITERKTRERRLEAQNEKLEVLNRIVRHDIRNDMQIVVSLAEVLALETDGDLADHATRVLDHADRVVELTRTARDLMETVLQDDNRPEPTPLFGTLETQLADVRSTYESALVRTTSPIPRRQVYADEMLGSVFRNILKNAVEHNDSDTPEVEVSVTESESAVTVQIADNGPGIPDDRKDEVFGKGTKGLDSDGTGIGLYLVNTLVGNYGGEVWIEDRGDRNVDGEPTGAVFTVRLNAVE